MRALRFLCNAQELSDIMIMIMIMIIDYDDDDDYSV